MSSILIENGTVVTMSPHHGVIKDGAIYIEGPKIVDVGKTRDLEKASNRTRRSMRRIAL